MKLRPMTPDGRRYVVAIDWFGRRLRNPVSLGRRRSARVLRANPAVRLFGRKRTDGAAPGATRRTDERKRRSRWGDGCDCVGCDLDGDLVVPLLVLLAAVLVVLAVVVGAPLLVAVLSVLLEFFYLVIAAGVVLLWRVLARRPWRVVAVADDGPSWHGEVVGWRRARAEVRRVAEGIELGLSPGSLGLFVTDRPTAPWLQDRDGRDHPTDGGASPG